MYGREDPSVGESPVLTREGGSTDAVEIDGIFSKFQLEGKLAYME